MKEQQEGPSRKVVVCHKGVKEIGWENLVQVKIKHPRTLTPSVYLLDKRVPPPDEGGEDDPFVLEVMAMEQEKRSWFVGDSVVSDGSLYVCAPMDPIFLIVPVLQKSSKGMTLKDHLTEAVKDVKALEVLCARLSGSEQMENVADKIVHDDIVAYKFSTEKTLNWLARKVKATAKVLQEKGITASEIAISSNFCKSSKSKENDDEFLQYAGDIVCEYVSEDLKVKLFEKMGLLLINEKGSKRKSEAALDNAPKKLKTEEKGSENTVPTEDYGSNTSYSNSNSNVKVSSKTKELEKAAKGTHSLFKFFAPKSK